MRLAGGAVTGVEGTKSLMLAVTSVRPSAVAYARTWSSGSPTKARSATAEMTSWPLVRSCRAMSSENISSSNSGWLMGYPARS